MIVDMGFGPIIFAIKYDVPLSDAKRAIHDLGGIERVAETMPNVFDFLRATPLKGYDR
jgi:hypothetical protein